jgi:hypothetical protein
MENKGRQTNILPDDVALALGGNPGRRPNNRNRRNAHQNAGRTSTTVPANPNGARGGQNGTNGRGRGAVPPTINTQQPRVYETETLRIPLVDERSNRRKKPRSFQTLKTKVSKEEMMETVRAYDKTGLKVEEFEGARTKEPIAKWISQVEVEAMGPTSSATTPNFPDPGVPTGPTPQVNTARPNREGGGPAKEHDKGKQTATVQTHYPNNKQLAEETGKRPGARSNNLVASTSQQGQRQRPTNAPRGPISLAGASSKRANSPTNNLSGRGNRGPNQNHGHQQPSTGNTRQPPKRKLEDEPGQNGQPEAKRPKKNKVEEPSPELGNSHAEEDDSDDDLATAIMAEMEKQNAEEATNLLSQPTTSTVRPETPTPGRSTAARSSAATRPSSVPATATSTALAASATPAEPNKQQRTRREVRQSPDPDVTEVSYKALMRDWEPGMTEHPIVTTLGLGPRLEAGENFLHDSIDCPDRQVELYYSVRSKTDAKIIEFPYYSLPSKRHLVDPVELEAIDRNGGVPPPYLKPGKHGLNEETGRYYFEGDPDLITGKGHEIALEDKKRELEQYLWGASYNDKYKTVPAEQVKPEDKEGFSKNEDWWRYFNQKYPKRHWVHKYNFWPCGCQREWDDSWSEAE